jgi:accessory gene regulator protein AgrB
MYTDRLICTSAASFHFRRIMAAGAHALHGTDCAIFYAYYAFIEAVYGQQIGFAP